MWTRNMELADCCHKIVRRWEWTNWSKACKAWWQFDQDRPKSWIPRLLFKLTRYKNGQVGERPANLGNSLQLSNSPPTCPSSIQSQKPRQFFNRSNLNCALNKMEAQPTGGQAKHFLCKQFSDPRAHHGAGADGLNWGWPASNIVSKWCQKHHKTGSKCHCKEVWSSNPFDIQQKWFEFLTQAEFRRLMLQRRGRLGRKCEESRWVAQ